jgi:chorismate dehydratase
MNKRVVKITAISYLNTIPFIYGIRKSGFLENYLLELDVPSASARKILEHKAEIGLVPVALLKNLNDYKIITDFCIGANGNVGSVVLLSNKPLHEIKKVFLDYDSLTSVNLVKVLAKHFWKIAPIWEKQTESRRETLEKQESVVAIGDKTFEMVSKFEYCYDLSDEWYKYTGLPFVFACWVCVSDLPEAFITKFSEAIAFGVKHVDEAIRDIPQGMYPNINTREYLTEQISFGFDGKKREALERFLGLME